MTNLHSASWPCCFHILTPTHSEIDSNRANTASQTLLSADSSLHGSGCCPAITSCENILHRSALFPPPTVLREMPYKGVGKSSFMLHFKETQPPPTLQKYSVLILKLDFFRNTLDVLTHQSPFGIWGILICLTTKLKVQSILISPFVYYLWFFLKQPFMDKCLKRENVFISTQREQNVSSSYWWIKKSAHRIRVGVLKISHILFKTVGVSLIRHVAFLWSAIL